MSAIQTRLNRQSESYNSNYEAMQALAAELEKKKIEALFQGEEKYIARIKKQGKLLARERIELLLDIDSPFMELLPFAGWGMDGFGTGAPS